MKDTFVVNGVHVEVTLKGMLGESIAAVRAELAGTGSTLGFLAETHGEGYCLRNAYGDKCTSLTVTTALRGLVRDWIASNGSMPNEHQQRVNEMLRELMDNPRLILFIAGSVGEECGWCEKLIAPGEARVVQKQEFDHTEQFCSAECADQAEQDARRQDAERRAWGTGGP